MRGILCRKEKHTATNHIPPYADAVSGLTAVPISANLRARSPARRIERAGCYFAAEREKNAYRAVLESEKKKILANTPAHFTAVTHGSHMRLLFDFFEKTSFDLKKFSSGTHPSTDDMQVEDGMVFAFKNHHGTGIADGF